MEKYAKFFNFAISLVIATSLSIVFVLGLKIFLPEPAFPQKIYSSDACSTGDQPCYDRQQREYQIKLNQYRQDYTVYSQKIFLAANIAGLVILILGIIFLAIWSLSNIVLGIIIAGLYDVYYAYSIGWNSVDPKMKLYMASAAAIIIIFGTIIWNRKNQSTKITT